MGVFNTLQRSGNTAAQSFRHSLFFRRQILETEYLVAGCVLQCLIVLIETDAEVFSDFRIAGVAPVLSFEFLHGFGDLAHLAMQRARRPISFADLIQHEAADPDPRIGLEARALLGVVIPRGFQQTDHARLYQIIHLDAWRQPRHQVIGDTLHQRCIFDYQTVAVRPIGRGSLSFLICRYVACCHDSSLFP